MIECVKRSCTSGTDSYLQFNSLILLDNLFQNILPVCNFHAERLKEKAWQV